MASKALGAALLDVTARTNASASDVIDGLSPRRSSVVEVDGSAGAAGVVLVQGSLRVGSALKFVTLATVTTGVNDVDLVHLSDVPIESMRIVYSGLTAGAVDVLVRPFVEDH